MQNRTIGILSPGEMGLAIGVLLRRSGHTVVTTLEGRSMRTAERSEGAGWTVLPSRAAVVEQASIVLSFVPPARAVDLLTEVIDRLAARARSEDPPIFVDGNSIAPSTAAHLAELCAASGVDFVDASIHGNSTHLEERSVLYLSGPRAAEVADLFGDAMRVRQLGTDPTRASRFKMTIAGVSKGASALLIEVASVAAEQGILAEWLEDCRHFYPGLFGRMETMLPTYARHSTRRATELSEMSSMVRELGLRPGMIEEAQRLVARVAESESDPAFTAVERSAAPLDDFLAALGAVSLLRPIPESANPDLQSAEPFPLNPNSSDREERTDEPTVS